MKFLKELAIGWVFMIGLFGAIFGVAYIWENLPNIKILLQYAILFVYLNLMAYGCYCLFMVIKEIIGYKRYMRGE